MAFQIVGLVADTASMLRRLQEAVNALGSGRSNAIGTLTLSANASNTTLTDRRIGIDSRVMLLPLTANAAAALYAAPFVLKSAQGIGAITFAHASNAQIDRRFDYIIQG